MHRRRAHGCARRGRLLQGAEVMVPVPMAELFMIAARQEHAGSLEEADRLLSYILAVAPHQPDALHMSGIVAFRLGRQQEAVDEDRAGDRARRRYRAVPAQHLRGLSHAEPARRRGGGGESGPLRWHPSDPLCLHNLAVIHYERVEIDESIDCAERALLMSPDLRRRAFCPRRGAC